MTDQIQLCRSKEFEKQNFMLPTTQNSKPMRILPYKQSILILYRANIQFLQYDTAIEISYVCTYKISAVDSEYFSNKGKIKKCSNW